MPITTPESLPQGSLLRGCECNREWLLKKYVSRRLLGCEDAAAEFFFSQSFKWWLPEQVLLVG